MNKKIGLWIDHKRAVILTIQEQGEQIQKLESGVEHIRYRGGLRSRVPYSTQYQQGDDQLDKQFNMHLNKFYDQVIALMRGADSVLIIGPGEAKLEFKKRLEHEKAHAPIAGIQPADKMTERQIAAKIRGYFQRSEASA